METVIVSIPAESSNTRPIIRSKWVLIGAAILIGGLFWWLGGRMGLSESRGFDGSLVLTPGAVGHVVTTIVMVLAAVALGTLIAGRVRADAGLFTAAIGLVALSIAGRPIYAVLHDAGGRGAYLGLAFELILLYGALGLGWLGLRTLRRRGHLPDNAKLDGLVDADSADNGGGSALGQHILTMMAIVVLLAQSENKKQVLAAVAIGSFVGAFSPWQRAIRPSVCYWTGPLAVGLIGYLIAYFSRVPGVEIGRPALGGGLFSALARPLPLDYAGVGTAGALIGYWMRRNSAREREAHVAAANIPKVEHASA